MLDHTATNLCNNGCKDEAKRLSEMNWIIAKRMENREMMVQCAAILAQMLTGDPARVDR